MRTPDYTISAKHHSAIRPGEKLAIRSVSILSTGLAQPADATAKIRGIEVLNGEERNEDQF
jgi:hypothetical protein